ncbi:MAG: hypothetical protein Q8P25_04775 [Candidatus Curtissbacteria bacterium]|nr:hypothetical protein [Candidatus Curtissbacteria bacterium]
MDENAKDKTLDNLTKAENILVAVAEETGFDGLAAGLAVYLSLVKLGKNAFVVAQEPKVGDAQSIYGVDKIGKATNKKTPIVVVQNAIDTVDKVTHFLDGNNLKLIIHPLPGSVGVKPEQISLEFSSQPANFIIAIGFDSKEALQQKITHEQQISPETWIITVNKGKLNQEFAQESFIDPQANSVSEVAARMLQDLALPLDEDISFNLYTAISKSTDNFSPAQVSAQTLEIASWLLKFGAGKASLAQKGTPAPQPIKNFQNFFEAVPTMEEVEAGKESQSTDWLKPPKIYKGSKSFGESKE